MKEEHAEGQAELVRALAVVHREWSCVLMKVSRHRGAPSRLLPAHDGFSAGHLVPAINRPG